MDLLWKRASRHSCIDGGAAESYQGLDLSTAENAYCPCCAFNVHDCTMTNRIASGEMYALAAVSWTLRIFLGLRAAPLCRWANRLLEAFGPKARQARVDGLLT